MMPLKRQAIDLCFNSLSLKAVNLKEIFKKVAQHRVLFIVLFEKAYDCRTQASNRMCMNSGSLVEVLVLSDMFPQRAERTHVVPLSKLQLKFFNLQECGFLAAMFHTVVLKETVQPSSVNYGCLQ